MSTEPSGHSHRYRSGKWEPQLVTPIAESAVSLTVNGQAWLTFMCTPDQLEALAVGFLYNEGVIAGMNEVADARICEHGDNVDVWLAHEAAQPQHWKRTSGCTGGVTAVEMLSGLLPVVPSDGSKLTPEQVIRLSGLLLESQDRYRETGGLHASALSDGERILVAAEDIGRHNTLDKVAGLCLMKNIWPERRILLTTGRISSEMLQKAARLGACVLISRTAPTSFSVGLAERLGITLIGYARGDHFTIYAHPERVEGTP